MAASRSSPGPVLYAFIFIVLALGAVLLVSDYPGPESLPGQVDTNNPSFDRVGGPDVETQDVSLDSVGGFDKETGDLEQCIEGYRQLVLTGRYYEGSPSPYVIAELKEKGLADPVNDLRADLKRHPELIPYEGVLGGTMGFYHPDKIHVLSSQWALALFGDGHIEGFALLKFAVTDNGVISWTTVDSFLD